MIPAIEQHRHQIADLCRLYGVKRLELFGSAASGEFDSAHSDVDFFYELDPTVADNPADRFFAFKEQLEALLSCKVDLVSSRHTTNPFFLEEANRYRQTLYLCRMREASARSDSGIASSTESHFGPHPSPEFAGHSAVPVIIGCWGTNTLPCGGVACDVLVKLLELCAVVGLYRFA